MNKNTGPSFNHVLSLVMFRGSRGELSGNDGREFINLLFICLDVLIGFHLLLGSFFFGCFSSTTFSSPKRFHVDAVVQDLVELQIMIVVTEAWDPHIQKGQSCIFY